MNAATYVYPWDVVGDDSAAETIAGLGVDHAVVAAFYHATRAFTPRHPWHRVVVAETSASYLPVGDAWEQVLPPAQTWVDADDAFGATASALAAAGVPTHAWVVVDHVDGFDAPHVMNAYGDVYPWALCPSHEAALEYAVGLAAVVAARSDIAGVEFEAAGWYGFDHLHEHDKVAGIPLSEDELFLLSLCFCDACLDEYQASGIDPARLRAAVSARLDSRFAAAEPAALGLPEADLAAAVLGMRTRVANRLRGAMVREVRTQREPDFPILFHANPDPRRSTAFTGVDVATLPKDTGVVVNCWNGSTDSVTRSLGHDASVNAGLLGVRGMGADHEALVSQAVAMREAGASGIRIYHSGIASNADLDAMRRAVSAFHKAAR
ncbi:hypothetical protein [Catenulispora pinisilvae]|uniref:hypothetical protein n=1 Tax=Catenulispora pinisilvae TaxID=2705253 RepID=UPI001891147E|nr:hypothetical protein [Catenulispora pinisilvae]